MTRVKICGLTNLEDSLVSMEAGADFLGFIFYPPSPRAVSVEEAQSITAHLRSLDGCPILVGVFVDATAEEMASVLDLCRLDLAQLSGQEPPGLVADPGSPIFGRSYKALKPVTLAEAQAEVEWYLPTQTMDGTPGLLIDTYHPGKPGGTGRTADWSIAVELTRSVPGLMLAGGLNPANVTEAIEKVRPFAVDVASGVESRPGRKDAARVRAFIEAVRARQAIPSAGARQ